MIIVKREYNNGKFIVEEIYSSNNKKIKENDMLWNTSEDLPITIAKSRHSEYVETTEDCDPIQAEENNEG